MASRSAWGGWIVFAGVVLLMVGAMDVLQGLVAIFEDEYVVDTRRGSRDRRCDDLGLDHVAVGRGDLLRRSRPARWSRVGALARDHRRGHQRDPADRVHGELPAGVSALEHPDRRAQRPRALRADGALARLQGSRGLIVGARAERSASALGSRGCAAWGSRRGCWSASC